ncbi:hypothetical protein SAMN02927924_02793 [Sphingobium faniae]|nr:hypothetical protein SAMN02927924_02793 [Sphingobium faniae]
MSDTASEAVTAFHLVAEIFRELDARFGPEFGEAVQGRVQRRMQDLLDSGNDVDTADGEALAEGLDWLKTILKDPVS